MWPDNSKRVLRGPLSFTPAETYWRIVKAEGGKPRLYWRAEDRSWTERPGECSLFAHNIQQLPKDATHVETVRVEITAARALAFYPHPKHEPPPGA